MTLRDLYVDRLVDLFNTTPGFPAEAGRSLPEAFDREEGSMLVIHLGNEVTVRTIGDSAERNCEIRFSTITRGSVPEKVAGDIMQIAHPLIMAFSAPNLMHVKEVKTDEPKFANGDGRACMITSHYLFVYRTAVNSLSG